MCPFFSLPLQITDLITTFEHWANPRWQEKWDNCGWQVEPGIRSETSGVLVCLTPTLKVMEEAIALKLQGAPIILIFAHQPLIFGGISAVKEGEPVGDMIRLAIAHNIGIYTAHTNFDQVKNGTADVLAQMLELQDVSPVEVTDPQADPARGYGRVGSLAHPQPLQHLLLKAAGRCQGDLKRLISENFTNPNPFLSHQTLTQSVALRRDVMERATMDSPYVKA